MPQPAPRPRRSFPPTGLARRHSVRVRLHDAVARGARRRGRHVLGGIKITTLPTLPAPAPIQTTVFDSETVRGRLGYAFDNVLLYGTGGWAWSNDQFIRTQLTGTLNLATAGTDEAVNAYLGGWTLGRRHRIRLGAELECLRRVSLLRILARPPFRSRFRSSPRLRRPK